MRDGARGVGEGALSVLLVEDDESDARLAELALHDERVGTCSLTRAATLADGLHRLARGSFDLVLLDLGLPDAGGLEALEAVRSIEDAPPIVVLTGVDDIDIARDAIRRGAQDYLVKGEPDRNPLARAVGYALERERAARRQRDRDQGYYDAVSDEAGPLRDRAPDAFAELLDRYTAALRMAWRRRRYEVTEDVSGTLRRLADDLAALGAGPRDVVDLHRAALGRSAPRQHAAARTYTDEARYVLLELMGGLAAGYRRAVRRTAAGS